jgi:hypothetical protein
MSDVLNLTHKNFGGYIKMGDFIAVLNILSFIRKSSDSMIKFHLPESELQKKEHVIKFKNFLNNHTNFFSEIPGVRNYEMNWEIWGFRKKYGEHVIIDNPHTQEKKICIFPLLNASYNTQRNWPLGILEKNIKKFSMPEYDMFKRIICIEDAGLINDIDIKNFSISTNFEDNLFHAMTCSHYVGGDTGFSHFTSVLSDTKDLVYYYSKGLHGTWESSFTSPFYTGKKGKMEYYEHSVI